MKLIITVFLSISWVNAFDKDLQKKISGATSVISSPSSLGSVSFDCNSDHETQCESKINVNISPQARILLQNTSCIDCHNAANPNKDALTRRQNLGSVAIIKILNGEPITDFYPPPKDKLIAGRLLEEFLGNNPPDDGKIRNRYIDDFLSQDSKLEQDFSSYIKKKNTVDASKRQEYLENYLQKIQYKKKFEEPFPKYTTPFKNWFNDQGQKVMSIFSSASIKKISPQKELLALMERTIPEGTSSIVKNTIAKHLEAFEAVRNLPGNQKYIDVSNLFLRGAFAHSTSLDSDFQARTSSYHESISNAEHGLFDRSLNLFREQEKSIVFGGLQKEAIPAKLEPTTQEEDFSAPESFTQVEDFSSVGPQTASSQTLEEEKIEDLVSAKIIKQAQYKELSKEGKEFYLQGLKEIASTYDLKIDETQVVPEIIFPTSSHLFPPRKTTEEKFYETFGPGPEYPCLDSFYKDVSIIRDPK